MSALMGAYREQLDAFRKAGTPLADYLAPCCAKPMSSPRPPMGRTYPSREVPLGPYEADMECPHCGENFHKIVHASGNVEAWALAPLAEALP